jgi:hypothetical protein
MKRAAALSQGNQRFELASIDFGAGFDVLLDVVLEVVFEGNHQTNSNSTIAAEASRTAVKLAASLAPVVRAKRFSRELPANAVIAKQTQTYLT